MSIEIKFAGGMRLTAVALACMAFSAEQALTQQTNTVAEQQNETAGDQQARLSTVTVTAQRRSESMQEVPVTITAFSADEIVEARIQQMEDIVSRTPGMSFDAFPPTQPRLFIRGIGSSAREAGAEPSAAVFIDDIYIGRSAAIAMDVFDVERIEVLKGPQGTLYGRNVVGGAVNMISKKPDINAFDASANATYGNFNRVEGAGFVNIPLGNNKSAFRLTGSYRSHDGYVSNPTIGEDVDDQDTTSARLQFYTEPTDTLRMHFTLDGTRDRGTGPANHVVELDESDPLSNFYTPNFDPEVTYGSYPGFQDRDTWGARAEVSNDFSFGTLTFLGSYRDLDYGFSYDFDGGNPDPTSPGFNLVDIGGGQFEEAEMSSQEIRLSSLPTSGVSWVIGLYHYNQQVQKSDTLILDADVIAPIPLTEEFYADATADSYAVFGDASVPLSEKWSVFGGLRYSFDDKSMSLTNNNSMVPLRADEFYDVDTEVEFDDWTWRVGAEYQMNSDHMLYGSIARGYRSGGLDSMAADAESANQPFAPEYAVQYEVGQKSTLLDGSMIWNNTLYYMDYSDLQTNQTVNGRNITSNAGKAHVFGYETQLDANLSEGFNIALAYAYTDGIFDEFTEGGVDYSGNRISRTPKHKITLSPTYSMSLSNGAELSFTVDYLHTSKMFDDNSNLPPEIRDPTTFVDARVILDNLGNGLSVALWGKNLTDERTRTWQGQFLGSNFASFNAPTTYGVTVTWDY